MTEEIELNNVSIRVLYGTILKKSESAAMRFFPKEASIAQPSQVQMPNMSSKIQQIDQTQQNTWGQMRDEPLFSQISFLPPQQISNILVPQYTPFYTRLNLPLWFHIEQQWLGASRAPKPCIIPVVGPFEFYRALFKMV